MFSMLLRLMPCPAMPRNPGSPMAKSPSRRQPPRTVELQWVGRVPSICLSPVYPINVSYTVIVILLMEEILHQLICSLSHHLQGLCIPGGAGFLPSTVPLINGLVNGSLGIISPRNQRSYNTSNSQV